MSERDAARDCEHGHQRGKCDLCDMTERAEKAEADVEALKRSASWLPGEGEPLDFEAFQGLKLRWATGPEEYQADADALISGLIAERAKVERLTAERDEARTEEERLRGSNLDGWEGRARILATHGQDMAFKGAVASEGQGLLRSALAALDEARAERVATDATMADTVASFGLAVANVEMLTTERNAAREDLSECEEEVTLRSQQRDAALDRCRRAAQIIIEEIGASGPESVEESAARVVAEVKKVRAALVRLDRLYADEVMPDTDRPGWLRDALHVRTEDEA